MEVQKMSLHENKSIFFPLAIALICMIAIAFSASDSAAAKAKQRTFASPEDAVKALVDAVKNNDTKELNAIFGPGSTSLISSGDEVADKAGGERFIRNFEEMNKLQQESAGKMILHVGTEDYPLPIPIVKKGERWLFDTRAGKEEILNRRIGRNELDVIKVLHAYVDAQRQYASKERDGDSAPGYARRLFSTEGKHDGLYWETKEGEEESPFGPLVAKAAAEGYKKKGGADKPSPFHGYYFRSLKAQGKHAPGEAYDYVVNGKMILGFALVAYPAQYGSSGIMTFIINQEGVVFQKDLGKNTKNVAMSMQMYDPDKTWEMAEKK
jgi:hypothetical protein